MSEQPPPPRVFISYAWESLDGNDAHCQWVEGLAKRLRDNCVDAWIDQYDPFPQERWSTWSKEQIEQASWVLVVCSEQYHRHCETKDLTRNGFGVASEWALIDQSLYQNKSRNRKFVAVLPPNADARQIPSRLEGFSRYQLDQQYQSLLRLLTGQPAVPLPPLGMRPRLPPRAPEPAGTPDQPARTAASSPQPITSPYPGLAAFTAANARFFFGRKNETKKILDRLRDTQLLSVVGGSGTGKSSLIAAGVVPALCQQHPALTCLRFKPQNDPLRQLAKAIDRVLLEERLRMDPKTSRGSHRRRPGQPSGHHPGGVSGPLPVARRVLCRSVRGTVHANG